jgi:YebC/PmpR family DNA-binding regulatory protein
MAGHSKWANIKHKKAATDAKKARLWSKLSKAIMVAARNGGAELDVNVRLRTLVADARAVSMPKDNIERAIKKGAGELDLMNFEEIVYEGYGPAGVAVMCDILTDNRNRTAPELRKLFEKNGGKLGATGCVSYLFERKGLFLISADAVDEEKLMEVALDSTADDVSMSGNQFEITCHPEGFNELCQALESAHIPCLSKEVTRIASSTVDLSLEDARRVLKMMEELDDHDDVQNVSANFNIPDDQVTELEF